MSVTKVGGVRVGGRAADIVLATSDAYATALASADEILTGSDDHIKIQAALDAVDGYRGKVLVLGNNISTGDTIAVPAYATLEFTDCIVKPDADFDVFEVKPGSGLSGAYVYTRAITFSKAAILINGIPINGNDWDYPYAAGHPYYWATHVHDMTLVGTLYDEGIGINMVADATNDLIMGLSFSNIRMHGFEYGIKERATGEDAWITAITWDNIYLAHQEYMVHLVYQTPADGVDGHIFTGLQLQPGSSTQEAIRCVGVGNIFNVVLWDWDVAAGTYALVFEEGEQIGTGNHITIAPDPSIADFIPSDIDQMAYALGTLHSGNYIHDVTSKKIWATGWSFPPDVSILAAADHMYSGEILPGTLGETVVLGELVYYKSDKKWWKTDADAAATTVGKLAIVLIGGAADATGKLLKRGYFRDDTFNWATDGGTLYVDEGTGGTAGDMTQTAPAGTGDQVRIVGYAEDDDNIWFDPDDSIEVVP